MNVNDLKTLEELLMNKHNCSEYIARVEAIYNSKAVYPTELNKLKNKKMRTSIICLIIGVIPFFFIGFWGIFCVGLAASIYSSITDSIDYQIRDIDRWSNYGLQLENTNKSEASVAHQILNGKLTWEVLRKPLADMDSQINRIVSAIPEKQRRIIFREKRSDEKERNLSDFASCISEIIRHMKHGDTFYSACEKADERYWKGVHARARCMEENQRIRNMEKNLSDIADGIRQGNADAERRYEEEKFRQEMRDIFRR